jgi:hypothetical protein
MFPQDLPCYDTRILSTQCIEGCGCRNRYINRKACSSAPPSLGRHRQNHRE